MYLIMDYVELTMSTYDRWVRHILIRINFVNSNTFRLSFGWINQLQSTGTNGIIREKFKLWIVWNYGWLSNCHTSQLCRLSSVNDLQYVAKQITASLLTCLQPLLLNRLNLLQPRAKASTPFSVIESHQEMLISNKLWKKK